MNFSEWRVLPPGQRAMVVEKWSRRGDAFFKLYALAEEASMMLGQQVGIDQRLVVMRVDIDPDRLAEKSFPELDFEIGFEGWPTIGMIFGRCKAQIPSFPDAI